MIFCHIFVVLLLLLCCIHSHVDALLCIVESPDIALPRECDASARVDNATNETLVLLLSRAWPESLSVAGFIATLECAFNGTLPEIGTPFAYLAAPRFTLGSAVQTNRIPASHLALGRLGAINRLRSGAANADEVWRVGVVPLLFVKEPLPIGLEWRPLDRRCAVHRARHPARHATLCAMSSGAEATVPFLTTAAHIDCDWAVSYYGSAEDHSLPLERYRFFFHLPRSIKSDMLVAVAGVASASAYTTVVFMDEDIIVQFNSTVWEAELRCAFGHVPVVWRPTFLPYSDKIWSWMNAECFGGDVRAIALGNFTFLEPQIIFMRADFFTFYIDQYVAPVFAPFPTIRSIWTLLSTICLVAEHCFPDAVPCALTTALTVEHADLRTLRKGALHGDDTELILHAGLQRFPITRFQLGGFDFVMRNQSCAPRRAIGAGNFAPWEPARPNRTAIGMRRLINVRMFAKRKLDRTACAIAGLNRTDSEMDEF
jgi:hypothetical protein